jgi:hypothetical protein
MKEKFASLKNLNIGTEIPVDQQRNTLGGYGFTYAAECYQGNTFLGSLIVSGKAAANPLGTCRRTWPQTTRATLAVY